MIKKESFIDVPGGKIWYQIVFTEKNKNKTPLILLHGGPGFPHNYLDVFTKIAKDRPVIFYDQLGTGQSQILHPDKNLWNLNRYVDELEILINHLKYEKVNIFGHSWGAALGIEYTLKHPDKVATLILASPLLSSKIWITDTKRLITQLPLPIQNKISIHKEQGNTDSSEFKNAMDVFYQHFLLHMNKLPDSLKYSFDHMNFDIYQTMWGESEFTVTGNLKEYDRFNDLKNLPMPVLITGGRFDEAIPETLTKAVALLPKGKLIIYEKSAHFAFLNEEKKYLQDLRSFLIESEKLQNIK